MLMACWELPEAGDAAGTCLLRTEEGFADWGEDEGQG